MTLPWPNTALEPTATAPSYYILMQIHACSYSRCQRAVKTERQYSIEELVRMAKRLPEEMRILAGQQTQLAGERGGAVSRFDVTNDELVGIIEQLGQDIAVLKSNITKGENTEQESRPSGYKSNNNSWLSSLVAAGLNSDSVNNSYKGTFSKG